MIQPSCDADNGRLRYRARRLWQLLREEAKCLLLLASPAAGITFRPPLDGPGLTRLAATTAIDPEEHIVRSSGGTV